MTTPHIKDRLEELRESQTKALHDSKLATNPSLTLELLDYIAELENEREGNKLCIADLKKAVNMARECNKILMEDRDYWQNAYRGSPKCE